MKKIKWLLMALCALTCTAITACDLSALMGDVGSSSVTISTESETESMTKSDENSSSASEETSEDSMSESDSTPDKNSDSSSEIMSGPDTPQPPEDSTPDDGGDEMPEWQIEVTVYFYTIHFNDEPLMISRRVNRDSTLKDFFNAYMGDMVTLYNKAHGFANGDENAYDADFLKEGFWQVDGRLMYENDRLAEGYPANAYRLNMVFTPSGAGMNIGICDCGDPLNCVGYATIPFPVGVYIADFVNWAYSKGIFSMTYEQSIMQGYWTEAGNDEPLTSEYQTMQSVLCFVRGQGGQDEEVLPSEFTVYMPTVYEYSWSEMGQVGGMATKDGQYTVSTGSITVWEVYQTIYGDNPDYTFHYYMDGVQVSEGTILTKDCTVVCVADSVDVPLSEFTITVYMDGMDEISYTYTRPVAMRDTIEKYCTAMGVKMSDYSWEEPESQMASFDINTAWAYDITIRGFVYVEPEKPTTHTINVRKYDGETETQESYTIPLDMRSGDFIREYLFPAFDNDNPFDNEYVFYFCSMYMSQLYGDEIFEYEKDILMIKKSVLDAGYTVKIDFMNRGFDHSEQYEQVYYEPRTISALVYEMTYYNIDFMTFQFTVDGKMLNAGEGKIFEEYEIYPRYKDITIVVRPAYEVWVNVNTQDEGDKTQMVMFYGGISLPAIAQAVGLSRDFSEYAWKIGYSEEYYWDENGFFMTSEYSIPVTIEARRVYTNFYFVNAEGMELYLESDIYGDYGIWWEWSVNVKTAFERMIGGDPVENFDDYTWIAKTEQGEFTVTENDILSYLVSHDYNYGEMSMAYKTVYSIIGTRKTVTVRVEESGINGQVEKGEQNYNAGLTVGEILSGYGYTQANVSWLMVEPLCGGYSNNFPMEWTWDSVVTWPIKIVVWI